MNCNDSVRTLLNPQITNIIITLVYHYQHQSKLEMCSHAGRFKKVTKCNHFVSLMHCARHKRSIVAEINDMYIKLCSVINVDINYMCIRINVYYFC